MLDERSRMHNSHLEFCDRCSSSTDTGHTVFNAGSGPYATPPSWERETRGELPSGHGGGSTAVLKVVVPKGGGLVLASHFVGRPLCRGTQPRWLGLPFGFYGS